MRSQIRGVLLMMSVLLVTQTRAWPASLPNSSNRFQSNSSSAAISETAVEQRIAGLTQNPDKDDKRMILDSVLPKDINELVLDNGNGNYSLVNGTSNDNGTDTYDLDKSNTFGFGFGGGPWGGGWGGPWGGGWGGGFGGPWGGPWGGGYGGFGGFGGFGGGFGGGYFG